MCTDGTKVSTIVDKMSTQAKLITAGPGGGGPARRVRAGPRPGGAGTEEGLNGLLDTRAFNPPRAPAPLRASEHRATQKLHASSPHMNVTDGLSRGRTDVSEGKGRGDARPRASTACAMCAMCVASALVMVERVSF